MNQTLRKLFSKIAYPLVTYSFISSVEAFGYYAYVANYGNNTVSVINTISNTS